MTLSMALWKAVADRLQLLLAVWDGGRVLEPERERLATLIHGRLDATLDPAVLARSADSRGRRLVRWRCRCPRPAACPTRWPDSCASASRSIPPPTRTPPASRTCAPRSTGCATRSRSSPTAAGRAPSTPGTSWPRASTTSPTRLQRGGDVGGLLGPLENDTALFERDLIVGGAERRDTRDRAAAAAELRDDLLARSAALQQLAARCVEAVDPAPKYAVPDVEALGPVPDSPRDLDAYRTRLARVADAMNLAHASYAAALSAHDDLVARLDALTLKASAQGLANERDLAGAEATAREVLSRRPCPVAVARALVDAYDTWLTLRRNPHLEGGSR